LNLLAHALAASHIESHVVRDLVLIFVSAAIVALTVQRLRLAVIPIYLITGILIGPHGLQFVRGDNVLGEISHIAVVLLLFGIGLQLHLSMLKHNLGRMVMIGVVSTSLSVAVGAVILRLFAIGPAQALTISMALALSSTAVVMRILVERREVRSTAGRLSLAILVIQDILVVIMLALLPVLVAWGGDSTATANTPWSPLLRDMAIKVGGVGLLILLARKLLPVALNQSAKTRSTELTMLVGIACALLAAMATQMLGFSLELGAFLAGFILAGTPFRFQLGAQIGAVRDLFNALFFTTLGMAVEPAIVIGQWWVFAIGLVLLLLCKCFVIGSVCWSLGVPIAVAVPVGCALAQSGEFSLILLSHAAALGIVDSHALAMCMAVIVASLIVTPGLITLGNRVSPWLSSISGAPWIKRTLFSPDQDDETDRSHVIVVGYGPVGRSMVDVLRAAGHDVTIIETNPSTYRRLRDQRVQVIFGDAGNRQILDEAKIETAAGVVLSFIDNESTVRAARLIKSIRSDVPVICRVLSSSDRAALVSLGVEHVVVEEEAVERQLKEVTHLVFDGSGN
jgi:CPA2 family monovalent cation:H+ antiporter-2